jgi:hypothetical protein
MNIVFNYTWLFKVTVTTLLGLAAVAKGAFNNLGACITDSFSITNPGAKGIHLKMSSLFL